MTRLGAADRDLLGAARTATLATLDPYGQPRLVPICFVLDIEAADPVLWSPIDRKPKRSDDPADLARVRDVQARPRVSVLVDRWSEDWSQLAWLRLSGVATVVLPDPADPTVAAVIAALRAKYPPYRDHDLERRPLLRIAVDAAVGWVASG